MEVVCPGSTGENHHADDTHARHFAIYLCEHSLCCHRLHTVYLLSLQLISLYLQATTVPHSSWVITGLGVRVAQDIGAHRRKSRKPVPTAEDELMKRAFWCADSFYVCDSANCVSSRTLVVIDRILSTALGRPCAIQDEEYVLDAPLQLIRLELMTSTATM
jgi:Fungal specific transcription factor domain